MVLDPYGSSVKINAKLYYCYYIAVLSLYSIGTGKQGDSATPWPVLLYKKLKTLLHTNCVLMIHS